MSLPDPTHKPPLDQVELTDGGSHPTATGIGTVSFVPGSSAPAAAPSNSPRPETESTTSNVATATRYEVQKHLGSGSFGSVSLAWDHQLQREVAIKRPRAGLPATALQSFLREAQLVASLRHPSVVVVHDVQVTEAGEPFIVYEYLPGQSLRQRLVPNSPLPLTEAISIATAIAEGLAAAHKLGLTHRDLKPANILFDAEGRPHIADFGLAVQEGQQQLLKGEVAGTYKYMAPEQVRGETHQFDGRTDLWALGVILYEMLTGRQPFTGDNPADITDQILHRAPRPPRQWIPEIPKEVEQLVLKLLAKPLAERIGSAHDVVEFLRGFQARSTGHLASSPRQSRLVLLTSIAMLLVISLIGGFAAASYYRSRNSAPSPRIVLTDEDFEAGAWTRLMPKSPPGAVSIDPTTVLIHESAKLSVSSQVQEYLLLGRTAARNFSFKLRLVPTQWQGESGIFLGYIDTPDQGNMTALLISLAKNKEGQCVIERQMAVQSPAGSQTVTNMTQLLRSSNGVTVGKSVSLQVDVDNGRVARIFVDGKQMKFDDEPFPGKAAAGMFGIYNQSGACTYFNPEFLRR